MVPSDAVSLLSFKREADLDDKLLYTLNEPYDYCEWQGVKCAQGRVVRFVVQDMGLRGLFPSNTLTRLDQLRVMSLRNNSLFGPIPDLSPLINLKSLFLDHNHFSGSFPPSILFLHRILTLSLSHNNLTGPVPVQLTLLDRLISLRLDSNSFSGSLPPLNQTALRVFNISNNNLTGPVPVTPTLSRFHATSFLGNPGLCGEILHKQCDSHSRFFGSSNNTASSSAPLGQNEESTGIVVVTVTSPTQKKHKKTGLALGFTVGVAVLAAFAFVIALVKKQKQKQNQNQNQKQKGSRKMEALESTPPVTTVVEMRNEELKVKLEEAHKSGKLVFCCGEVQNYTLEQLMRASAELLGRGSLGTTYKAVLDSHLILTVKRLDAGKTAVTSGEVFEKRMEMVGRLRHPNLIPLRAYFQAKGERLIIYDYQPNGSLFNLVHGSRSARAKPLHWTSCLKIAEDVAHGLAYMHQASSLIHGNLKSSNVLLGVDFEACITDYSLAFLAGPSSFTEDPDSAAYKAPEVRKSSRRATSKSDVYAFGVLLLELLTGKHPSQHPFLVPTDLQDWVRAMRDDDGCEDNRLEMLTEVASICSATSPEQRPAMWQVLKMIQGIKDSVAMEDTTLTGL
ncbi:probable inactive receptor kinase At5g67200 [Gastrolobium bilobum]|uniref:probable inactive receptor kinase At5g67200 n=1 Tax=Gastrolobium bilobum TaxID=150636 RepID=UPI002AB2C122|nr:probable inactive receptor kinase At5g67200 [Gastrolobium bilobum]